MPGGTPGVCGVQAVTRARVLFGLAVTAFALPCARDKPVFVSLYSHTDRHQQYVSARLLRQHILLAPRSAMSRSTHSRSIRWMRQRFWYTAPAVRRCRSAMVAADSPSTYFI